MKILLKLYLPFHETMKQQVGIPVIKEEPDPGSEAWAKVKSLQAGVNEGMVYGVKCLMEIKGH